MQTNIYDIIIIGGGISGLYSAYKIKKINPMCKILIIEKNGKAGIGGRANNYIFEGVNVVIGAGIVRKKKDKLLIKLLNELKIEGHEFLAQSQYSKIIKTCFVKKIFIFLKKNYKASIDKSKTFKKYALRKLSKDTYKNFVNCSGYSDYENEDAYDTLHYYGFDDNYSKFIGIGILWKDLVESLVEKIGIENILTSNEVNKINYSKKDKKFLISTTNNTEDCKFYSKKVIIATTASVTKKLISTLNVDINKKIYDQIHGQPFLRLYGKFSKNNIELLKNIILTTTIVGGPIHKIIPINSDKGIYMIAYTDNKGALSLKKYIEDTEYNRKYLCNLLEKSLGLFKDTLKLLKIKGFYWKEGTHYYDPLSNEFDNRKAFIKVAQMPMKNMRIVGEMICLDQGWTQGALDSVEKVVNFKFVNSKFVNSLKKGGNPLTNLLFPQATICYGSTKIIRSHGSVIDDPFQIPENVNIITVTELGNTCPLSQKIDSRIFDFYSDGNTIFENNDNSNSLTENGKLLQNSMTGSVLFKNHVGPCTVNNLMLDFKQSFCSKSIGIPCAIDCITKKNDIISTKKDIIPKWHTKNGYQNIEKIKLSDFIMYNGYNCTYIVIACRSFNSSITTTGVKLARQISSGQNISK